MPYGQELQETLQVARQQLKAVADNRECEGLPPKQWSRCNRQDLVEICVWARKKKQILVLPARGHSLHVGCCSSLSTLVAQM